MAYIKTTYVNGSSPYINATNLNKAEQGIYDNDARSTTNATNIGTLSNLTTTSKTNLVSAINEVNGLVAGIETLLASI